MDLDYFRFFVSKATAVGVRVGDIKIAGVSEYSVMHVRRGDADLLPRPDLILEYGDRVGLMAGREDRDAVRAHFGDSIKGTAEFSTSRWAWAWRSACCWAFSPSRCLAWAPSVSALLVARS